MQDKDPYTTPKSQIFGKVKLKYGSIFLVVISISMIFSMQFHVPYMAKNIYKGIKIDMDLRYFLFYINDASISPTGCYWKNGIQEEKLYMSKNVCKAPENFKLTDEYFEVTVLYMGPVFQKNEFNVIFKNHVTNKISEFKSWD